jgi:hypothetical protein
MNEWPSKLLCRHNFSTTPATRILCIEQTLQRVQVQPIARSKLTTPTE